MQSKYKNRNAEETMNSSYRGLITAAGKITDAQPYRTTNTDHDLKYGRL